MSKLKSLQEAVSLIKNGDTVAIGGNVLHRAPHQFLYELCKGDVKDLNIIKTAGAHDVDLLCLSEKASSVVAGFISYESEFGLCRFYRKGVESGKVKANEHACYTVISAIRASVQGVPFMPFKGLDGSDLMEACDYFATVKDPFSGEEIKCVKAIRPDVAIIHAQEADENGNVRIYGPVYEDVLFAKGSKKVIVTAERIVSNDEIRENNHLTTIPSVLVDCVVELKGGATPGSCSGEYDFDREMLKEFLTLKDKEELKTYLTGGEN